MCTSWKATSGNPWEKVRRREETGRMGPEDEIITVFATITGKEGQGDMMLPVLQSLLEPTLAEPGCLQFILHRSMDSADKFIFYEQWKRAADLDLHKTLPHFVSMATKMSELGASAELQKTHQVLSPPK